MGSYPKPDTAVKLPTITLDTTLADLYARATPKAASSRIGFVFTGVNSALDLTDSFPRNDKFLYQDSPFNTLPTKKLVRTTSASLQHSLATKYLSLIAQRDAFIAGPASSAAVICFPVDAADPEHSRREAEATISVLDPSQRPELVFCPGPAYIPPLSELNVDRIACKVVLDGLEGLPLTVPLETTWYLNSKAALADSKLPTPRMDVVEVSGFCAEASECCEVCVKDGAGEHFVPVGCSGARGKWIKAEEKRILDAVRRKPVPFVLKNQQTFGGAGTWVVNSEEDKTDLLETLSGADGVLRKMLARVTQPNHHLKPATIIISDMVKDPIGDYGITFFVTDKGDAIFLGASEQMTDSNNSWIGSTIKYTHQDALREQFDPLVRRTAAWLAEKGYYGPAGMDVLESGTPGQTDSHTGEETAYHIVDLNVRTSGSMCLPVMRGHFTKLGLNCASSFSLTVKGSREEFIEISREDFESGRMCILSWYHDLRTNKSIGDVVIGGSDEADLQKRMKRVRDLTEEVVF
ncbi:Solid-state culture specific [Coniochaeta hoffmannii]|uniref:Solid-state culture specific n=1 Tax=Coniochaeta hoffmannii TaxID=91930 RepID=A0AA38RFM4_9PEZI|nr:Solid-state culture specific [Coniochaeta hoffmannii]